MAIKKTPALFLEPPSFRKDCKSSRGFQIGSPLKITVEDDDTMIPMKEVMAKPMGIVKSCDQRASLGLRAKRAKSGSFTISVAKLAIADMMPVTIPHANLDPVATAGWCTIGPMPWARTIAQMKKAIPAVGTT
jgi:hypothetical protein